MNAAAGIVVQAESIDFKYRRSPVPILSGLSVEFLPGVLHGIEGPSGGGKSTLLFILGLLARPDRGVLRFDGMEVSKLHDRQRSMLRSESIGFLFQDANLDPRRSVLENVVEPGVYARRRANLDRAYELLRDLVDDVPYGRRPGQISGGQAQRIALCRALSMDPSLVLADEPTGNLDSTNRDRIVDVLAGQASAGSTVVIVSHDRAVLERCGTVTRVGGESDS